jgi:hypothetical protein
MSIGFKKAIAIVSEQKQKRKKARRKARTRKSDSAIPKLKQKDRGRWPSLTSHLKGDHDGDDDDGDRWGVDPDSEPDREVKKKQKRSSGGDRWGITGHRRSRRKGRFEVSRDPETGEVTKRRVTK